MGLAHCGLCWTGLILNLNELAHSSLNKVTTILKWLTYCRQHTACRCCDKANLLITKKPTGCQHPTLSQTLFNSLRPRQNGRLFADDTFKRIFLNENIRISTKNSLKFVPKGLINNIPALVLIMAWRRPGDKPLSEPMLVRSLTHICVTRPQCVNGCRMISVSHNTTRETV